MAEKKKDPHRAADPQRQPQPAIQTATLKGLGLGKMRTRTLEDTPAVRGMIRSIQHLVEIVEDKK